MIDPPRRIRCVRRRNGRIDKNGTEWTVEHPSAQETYDTLREIDKLKKEIEEQRQTDDDDTESNDWPISVTNQLIEGLCQGEIDPETADQLSDAIIRATGGDPDDLPGQ